MNATAKVLEATTWRFFAITVHERERAEKETENDVRYTGWRFNLLQVSYLLSLVDHQKCFYAAGISALVADSGVVPPSIFHFRLLNPTFS